MYRLGQKVGRALRRSPEVRHENAIAQARARVAQLEKKLRMAGEPGDTPMVDVRGMSFLEPWAGISAERGAKLEAQLARELPRGHILDGRPSTAVAARGDQDDVLFEVPGLGYVVVHLSWSRGRATSAEWPRAQVYATLEQWRDRMKRDHEEFLP
jgi:hypothetical protein